MKAIRLVWRTAIPALAFALATSPMMNQRSANAATDTTISSIVVWDGNGAGWANPTTSSIQPESTDVHDSKTALAFKFNDTGHWLGAGWNWLGFKKGAFGTDITQMRFLTFWVKSSGTPTDLQINLLSNGPVADTPEHHTDKIHLGDYCPNLSDGAWHQVKIPLIALKQPDGFDAQHVCEMQLGLMADHAAAGSYVFDDIAFTQ